jgi:HD-like signal output (HDOD) protein/GGDEF domain-containing protein
MQSQVLSELARCDSLPSLPAIAARIIELTQDPDVKLDDLAALIQNDQALAAKILRTVNSSYFGLRQRCGSIERALALMGLSPVRSLVLGFSLVDTVGADDQLAFDFVAYWRRGLLTAMGAKAFGQAKGFASADEAFLGGLLQDVGMIVLHRALGDRYESILERAGGIHSDLLALEINELETHHADVGAMLAETWKLPEELVLCVRYHERPTAAPQQVASLVRCVALGNLVHDALVETDPAPALRGLYEKARAWFDLTPSEVDDILISVVDSAKDVSKFFSLKIGTHRSNEEIIAEAERQMLDSSRSGAHESYAERGLESAVIPAPQRDGLTGAITSQGFLTAIRAACPDACQGKTELTVAQFVLDGADALTELHGPEATDEAVIGAVAHLRAAYEPMGGIVCRLAPTIFGVVLPNTGREPVLAAAERFRAQFPISVSGWLGTDGPATHPLRVSAGVATIDARTRSQISNANALITAAASAIKDARAGGGDAVRAYTLQAAA